MTKLAFYLSLICSLTGLLLLIPANPVLWEVYSLGLVFHVVGGIGLFLVIIFVSFTHIQKGVKQMAKGRIHPKSHSGLWYFIVILMATATGIFIGIRSGFAVSWVVPFHLVAGLWCLILSLKHSLKKVQSLFGFKKAA